MMRKLAETTQALLPPVSDAGFRQPGGHAVLAKVGVLAAAGPEAYVHEGSHASAFQQLLEVRQRTPAVAMIGTRASDQQEHPQQGAAAGAP